MAGRKSLYTAQQWQWCLERWREGYTMTEIGDFLGMNRESVRRRFQRMGARPYLREDLPPLTDRKEEFNQLEEIEENERV